MTVGKLIEKLQKLPADKQVVSFIYVNPHPHVSTVSRVFVNMAGCVALEFEEAYVE